jgi:tRNA (adenine57-N1/adenine58-N1)-methyltransferase catalytic subunit
VSEERLLQAGEQVILSDLRGRRYLITLRTGQVFHTHHGAMEHDELIGAPEGSWASTTSGSKLLAFRPTMADYVLKMKRGAQVVYPKDLGSILVYADIFPGARVLEAGTGSGALTIALARAVGESGSVISYDVREDHLERGRENVEIWYSGLGGKPENIELRLGDIFEGVPERGLDRMVLDLPEPWRAIGTTTESLALGGIVCSYLPTIPQVMQLAEALRAARFAQVNTFETLIRTWNVEGQSVRPDHRMVAHTGFIVTARKVATSPE